MASDLSHDAPPTTTQPPALDAGALRVIRQCAGTLVRYEDAFVRQLHYDIMDQIPDSAAAPDLDMWPICERLVQSLLWVATTSQPLHVIVETLHQVGARNWLDGFPGAHYGSVAHALVQTVHYLSGSDWSASTGSAWITYFMWIEPHLLAGAQQAAIQQAAAQQAAIKQAAAQRAVAEQEAARVEALSRDPNGGRTQVVSDVNIESVASLLYDDDDEDAGYGQIMLSMTRTPRREPPRHPS
jgi:hypothetical protein